MGTDLWPTGDSAHSWWLYSAAQLGYQAASTMTCTTQSHYPDTEPTSPCPILLMLSANLGSDKYQFYKSLVWIDHEPNSRFGHRDQLAHRKEDNICLFPDYLTWALPLSSAQFTEFLRLIIHQPASLNCIAASFIIMGYDPLLQLSIFYCTDGTP